ncbi:uncharacterized protein P174DRAFT_512001 [Aspergillus novofumigatus IBT 16806]|uniref:Uncharacterized protein n=1 Tax=Aspergillus novofumigatus (strain IBT 16806) TaxID=1392255 RepID=A0A2I1C7W5_ASPN1|nr:uncharacterized protein P174DRAFT_512001 [Aspergillus novofumigatus IBT 16806]PKX93722.1 hypothetical protein P174DRAFT_512001 [Aspergillus novofumigatus IBT 16806]
MLSNKDHLYVSLYARGGSPTIPGKEDIMLLVHIMVGKVADGNHLVDILQNTPIQQGQAGWNWLKASSKALGTNVIEWERVRNEAMRYCQQKKDQHRFDGQGNFDTSKAPTYDLVERREVIG